MSRGLLALLLGGLLVAGLAVLLLTSEGGGERASGVLRRSAEGPAGAPGFHGEVAEGRSDAAPEPTHAEPLPATGSVPDATSAPAPAARPRGPVRRLSGRVVRLSDDSPLPGASVSPVRPPGADGGEEASTVPPVLTLAPDGSFELADVSVDVKQVQVLLMDRWPREPSLYPLPDVKGDIAGLELPYDSGFRVRGTVRDSHGAPLPHASAGVPPQAPVTADATGHFELQDVAPGKDKLSITAYAEAPWYMRTEQALLLPGSRTAVLVADFTLAGSGALEGSVIDTAGQPVAGTEVRLGATMTSSHGESSPQHLVTKTEADGHYRLDHVPEGRYLVQVGTDAFAAALHGTDLALLQSMTSDERKAQVLAEATGQAATPNHGLAPRWIPDVVVETGKATRLDVTLDRGSIVEGRVTDSGGVPLAGASVTLERLQRWPAPDLNGSSISYDGTTTITSSGGQNEGDGQTVLSATERSAKTGDDGRYRFETVTAGEKRLEVLDSEQRCAVQKRELTVQGTTLYANVDFVLSFGLTVRGRVTDPAGRPLPAAVTVKPAGTQVFTAEGQVRCDDDGWFEVRGLAEGEHSANISCSGYRYAYETVRPGEPPRTFVLKPSPKVYGIVTDAATDLPVVRFGITIEQTSSIMQSGEDDHAEGRFDADVAGDEPLAVSVNALGYQPLRIEQVSPESTSETAPLHFRLQKLP